MSALREADLAFCFETDHPFAMRVLLLMMLGASALAGCQNAETYAQHCRVPLPHWRTPGNGWHHFIRNDLRITEDGSLQWNGKRITRSQAMAYAAEGPKMNPEPVLILNADPLADCKIVRAIRNEIDQTLRCKQSQKCGEGEGDWNSWPAVTADDEAAKLADEALEEAARQEP